MTSDTFLRIEENANKTSRYLKTQEVNKNKNKSDNKRNLNQDKKKIIYNYHSLDDKEKIK